MSSQETKNLPFSSSFIDRHGKVRWRFRRGGITIPLPGDPRMDEHRGRYNDVISYVLGANVPKVSKPPKPAPSSLVSSAIVASFNSAKKRARESGKPFTITVEQVQALAKNQLNRCALTGIHFQLGKLPNGQRNPCAPSIDRVNCSRGYEIDNIRLVLHSVNVALNMWGDDHFLQICLGRVKMAG